MFWNKIFGAALATLLVIMGVATLSDVVFGAGHGGHGGHGGHHGEEKSLADRYAYYVELVETTSETGEVEVFDLGLELASADIDRGQRSFQGKCSSCHTVDQGAPNGTGPNLWNVVSRDVAGLDGFNYSAAFAAYGGDWRYENLDAYLENPKGYIAGTAMSFAGLKKDPERMNVIAYLSTLSEDPVPFPAPLAVEDEISETIEVTDAVEAVPADDAVEVEVNPGAAVSEEVLEDLQETVEDGANAAADTVTDAVDDLVTEEAPSE